MNKLRNSIVKHYKWIDIFMFTIITILKIVISIELLNLGYRGIGTIINGKLLIDDITELIKSIYIIFMTMRIIYWGLLRLKDDRKGNFKNLINLAIQSLFYSFFGSLVVLGMFRITAKDTWLLTYDITCLMALSIVLCILEFINKSFYKLWLEETETLAYEVLYPIKIDYYRESEIKSQIRDRKGKKGN